MDDINIRYLRWYFNKYGTINNISTTTEVEFEGQIVKIGCFLGTMRNRYKIHREGKGKPGDLALWRYKELNSMRFEWTPSKTRADTVKSKDPYIKYLRRHYNLYGTINDITRNMEVEFEGKTLRIGAFVTATRIKHRHYLNGDNTPGCASKTALERYKILEQMKIEWEPREKENMDKLQANDRHIRYLRQYYEENGTINDIPVREVVMFENELLKIGNFLEDIRSAHRKYAAGEDDSTACSERSLSRYKALDEMEFNWNPGTKRGLVVGDEAYIEYFEQFFFEQGSLDNIALQDLVIFGDKVLKVRQFIKKIKSKHSNYINGVNNRGSFSKKSLRMYDILDSWGFDWNERKSETAALAIEYNVSQSMLDDYLNRFAGDLDKALAFSLRNRDLDNENALQKASKYSMKSILMEFDIDSEALFGYLNRDVLRTGEFCESPVYDDQMSLVDFCKLNEYRYDIVVKAVRLKLNGLCDEPFDSLLNRCIIDCEKYGQVKVSTWIFGKYGNEPLVRHMLVSIGADSASVLRDMSWHAIDIEEALLKDALKKTSSGEYDYLEALLRDTVSLYQQLRCREDDDEDKSDEALKLYMEQMRNDYHLSDEEFDAISGAFDSYTSMIYQYHLFEVGFEKDREKRIQKIIDYRFDEDDIEEAFFIPLRFEEKVLLGRDSELYKRRSLLKNLTVSWNYLTSEERARKISVYCLTEGEVNYVSDTRKHIDEIKEEVSLVKKI